MIPSNVARLAGRVSLVLLSAAFAADALAQVQEITVTTRKREEKLQEIPVAVTAFGAGDVERLAINDLRNLAKMTSGIIFDTGFAPQDTRITIRGLAPVRGRQNVAILQDGIDISSQAIQTNGGSLLINPRLFDVERIEVVKGPQNALYGRTAFNGAINYVMRQPTEELTGRIYTDIGSNGQAELRGGLSGALIGDRLLGEISGATWNFDGFYDNETTGGDLGGQQGTAFAGTLLWKATDRLTFRLRGETLNDEYDPFPYRQIVGTTPLSIPAAAFTQLPIPGSSPPATSRVLSPAVTSINAVVGTLPDGKDLTPGISSNPRNGGDYPGIDRDINRFTLTGTYDFDAVTLTYLGHSARAKTNQFYDSVAVGDTTSGPTRFIGAEIVFDDRTELQSHELRLSSNGDNKVDWVAGGLYWKEDVEMVDGGYNCINNGNNNPAATPFQPPCGPRMATINVRNSPFPGVPLNPDFWSRETTHWSVYGLVDWEFIDRFNLILEGRYTREALDASGPNRNVSRIIGDAITIPPGIPVGNPQTLAPALGQVPGSRRDDFFSPKATIQWRATDAAQVYFSWAQAAKPAGIALLTGGAGGFDPKGQSFDREEMQVWELGAKSEWFDRRLTVNGAVFFQDYNDKQVSVQVVDPVTNQLVPRTQNASSAEVWGFELDAQWVPTDWLSLFASYTYLDTEYTDFFEETRGAGNIAQASVGRPNNCVAFIPDGATQALCRMNLSGNQLEYAPEHAAVVGFTLQKSLSNDITGFFEGNAQYQDERYMDRFNVQKLDSFTTVDFRLGLRTAKWDLIAYVDNAFENTAIKTGTPAVYTGTSQAFFFPGPFTFVIPPSTLAVLPDLRQFGVRASFRFGGER
jgi:outer membrane receptor protein involved in Fe transport